MKLRLNSGRLSTALFVECGGDVGAVSFHQRYIFRRYRQLFFGSADLKFYIDPGCLVGVDGNAR